MGSTSTPERRIMVFCPTPLLTVTIEGKHNHEPDLHVHAGGQGFWVARMVARFGLPVTLCAPLGGDTGRLIDVLVEAEDVQLKKVSVSAHNGSYVHDRRPGDRMELCRVRARSLNRHEFDDLYNAAFSAGMNADLVALTGQYPKPVIPSSAYERLAHDLRANGRMVIADLTGNDLHAALAGGLDALCFSHEELIREGLIGPDDGFIEGMRELAKRGARRVILHRGGDPTLALSDDELFEVISPKVKPLDHRGGGDTFFAALAVGLVQNQDFRQTLRYAAAAGTLNVTRHGLGSGRRPDIEELSRHVEVRSVPVT